MDFKHTEKIVETYHKLLNLTDNKNEIDEEILEIILDAYTYAYNNGVADEKNKMIPSTRNRLGVDKEKLLKKCRGEIPLNIEELETQKLFDDLFARMRKAREEGKSLLGERKPLDTDNQK